MKTLYVGEYLVDIERVRSHMRSVLQVLFDRKGFTPDNAPDTTVPLMGEHSRPPVPTPWYVQPHPTSKRGVTKPLHRRKKRVKPARSKR